MSRAISDREYWTRLNNVLSEAVGQVDHLPDELRMQIQRRDRAIQAYERVNDRSHVVYTNVQLPPAVNRGNVDGFINRYFAADSEVDFDRFTAGRHTMHELEGDAARGFEPLFEIETRRGMYLGQSGRKDRTDHLLPRGMRLRVIGHHMATYRRPDGSTGQRRVIQLREVTDESTGGETP